VFPNVARLTASSNGQANEERLLIERLARRNLDGIVVVSSTTTADIPGFDDPGIPILFLDCPSRSPDTPPSDPTDSAAPVAPSTT
jgi:DNA-binding LacI/PurR family transcriptional regulator